MTKSDLSYLMLIVSVSSSLYTTTSILQGLRDLEGRWEKGSDRAKKANSIQVTKKSVCDRDGLYVLILTFVLPSVSTFALMYVVCFLTGT